MLLAALTKLKGRTDTPTLMFLILFTHMQLIEYFLWKNINDPARLEFWSKIGAAIIVAQPLFLINMMKDSPIKTQLFTFWLVFVLGWFLIKARNFETKIGKNGHLEWNWFPGSVLWGVLWVATWFLPLIFDQNYKLLVLALAGFIPSIYFFLKYNTWGTMWCWISNIAWLFYFHS